MNEHTSAQNDPIASGNGSTSLAQGGSGPRPSTGYDKWGGNRGSEPSRARRWDWQAIAQFSVAFLIICVYIASMWLMTQHRGDPAPQWDRLVFLFSGFEAIVFVAAGAIFGTRVQRASVEAAQEQSRQAREDLGAERKRAARADKLEESTADFVQALRAYAAVGSQGTGNGQPPITIPGHPGRTAARGPDGSEVPITSDNGLNYAIWLAEYFFSPSRR